MHPSPGLLDSWLLVVAIMLAAALGLGVAAVEAANAARRWFWAARPQPRKWELTICDPDGIPLRSVKLTQSTAGHLLRDIDHGRFS